MISPRLAIQKGDFLGSGVPYWPLEAAITAAFLRETGEQVQFLDLFGLDPSRLSEEGDHYWQGIPLSERIDELKPADVVILYAISYMSHGEVLNAVELLKRNYPEMTVLILENSQAVTAYDISLVRKSFFTAGADGLICGEIYHEWSELKAWLGDRKSSPLPQSFIPAQDGDRTVKRIYNKDFVYPFPAWDLIPYRNYWRLPYSHGPKSSRYFPILTSRGCPFPCDFCVVPATNDTRWRARRPEDVVSEIIHVRDTYGVRDFQIEDLNPTVKASRWEEVCRLLVTRAAGIRFYIVSGTKAETIPLEQVPLLAEAGCRYVSISPESGSKQVMANIGKRFDYAHGEALVSALHRYRIRTQACFLVGHPAETDDDFVCTKNYMTRLLNSGLDEVAVFIVAPFAGSRLFKRDGVPLSDPKALPSFSPKGRKDFEVIERRRRELIRHFFYVKLTHGVSLWFQGLRALIGCPQTKMENLPRRVAYVLTQVLRMKVRRLGSA